MTAPLPSASLFSVILAVVSLLAGGCGTDSGRTDDGDRRVIDPLPARAASAPGELEPGQGERSKPDKGPGYWRRFKRDRYQKALDQALAQEIEQLEAIGYLRGSSPARDLVGVTRHDVKRAFAGYNLYTAGHQPAAFLMDMRGRVLHRWAASYEDVWPGTKGPGTKLSLQFWRRVELFDNGDLLVIWDGHGIARLDRDSRVIWKRLNAAHHDLDVSPDGEIYALAREAHVIERIDPKHAVLEDFVLVLDSRGEEKRRVSLIEAFERSIEFGHIWASSERRRGDVFHTNTIELLDGRIADRLPAFAAGNVLISIRFLDAIAVVDLERREVVWAATGTFKRQHDPTVLDSGNLLLFDNTGPGPDRFSAVQEYDPVAMKLVWEYRGSKEVPFYSHTCGAAQRLPGGNTLITESDAGRAIEVTRDKKIVWEFFNPHRAGDEKEYIATLFEVQRLPPDFPVSWTSGPQPAAKKR